MSQQRTEVYVWVFNRIQFIAVCIYVDLSVPYMSFGKLTIYFAVQWSD